MLIITSGVLISTGDAGCDEPIHTEVGDRTGRHKAHSNEERHVYGINSTLSGWLHGQAQGTAPTILDEAHKNEKRHVYGRGSALCLPVRTLQ